MKQRQQQQQMDGDGSSQEMDLDQEDQDNQMDDVEEIQNKYKQLMISLVIDEYDHSGNLSTEMIRDFPVHGYLANESKDLVLSELIDGLKKMHFNITGNMIYYFCNEEKMYVYCGYDPLPGNILIPYEDYEVRQLRLKFRQNPVGLIHQIMTEETYENKQKQKDQNVIREENSLNKCRRTKERKIGFIIEKVAEWRKLYNGTQDEQGRQLRYSLEEAAQKVNISKKSLDDYLLQIRFGKKFGFNFNEHHNEKVGVLRAFVKKEKNKSTNKDKSGPNKSKATKKIKLDPSTKNVQDR